MRDSDSCGGAANTSRGTAALHTVAAYYCSPWQGPYYWPGSAFFAPERHANKILYALVALARTSKALRLEVAENCNSLVIGSCMSDSPCYYMWSRDRSMKSNKEAFCLDFFDLNTMEFDFAVFPNLRTLKINGLISEQGVECVLGAVPRLRKLERLDLTFALAPREQTMLMFIEDMIRLAGARSRSRDDISEDDKRILAPIQKEAIDMARKRIRPLVMRFANGCQVQGRSIFSPLLKILSFQGTEATVSLGDWSRILRDADDDDYDEYGYRSDTLEQIVRAGNRVMQRNLPPTATLWFALNEHFDVDRLSMDQLRSLLASGVDLDGAIDTPGEDFTTFLQFMMATEMGSGYIYDDYREQICFALVEAGASTAALRRAPCKPGDYEACMALVAKAAEAAGGDGGGTAGSVSGSDSPSLSEPG